MRVLIILLLITTSVIQSIGQEAYPTFDVNGKQNGYITNPFLSSIVDSLLQLHIDIANINSYHKTTIVTNLSAGDNTIYHNFDLDDYDIIVEIRDSKGDIILHRLVTQAANYIVINVLNNIVNVKIKIIG